MNRFAETMTNVNSRILAKLIKNVKIYRKLKCNRGVSPRRREVFRVEGKKCAFPPQLPSVRGDFPVCRSFISERLQASPEENQSGNVKGSTRRVRHEVPRPPRHLDGSSPVQTRASCLSFPAAFGCCRSGFVLDHVNLAEPDAGCAYRSSYCRLAPPVQANLLKGEGLIWK